MVARWPADVEGPASDERPADGTMSEAPRGSRGQGRRVTKAVIFLSGKDTEAPDAGIQKRSGAAHQIGGYTTYVLAHARAAAALGFEPHIFSVASQSATFSTDYGVVHRVRSPFRPVRQSMVPFHLPILARAVEDFGVRLRAPVLIHGFVTWGAVSVAAARRLNRRGVASKAITSFFSLYEHESQGKVLGARVAAQGPRARLRFGWELAWTKLAVNRSERVAYERSDLVAVNYESVRHLLTGAYGPRSTLRRIGYAPETAFLLDDRQPDKDRPEDAVPLIVCVSRHDPRKGVSVLIEALAILRTRGIRVEARLVGAGPLSDVHQRLIEARGLSDIVSLLGSVPDPMEHLALADIYVLPSLEEGSGSMSLLEAMQAGVAPVVSAIDGLPEDVEHDINGLLVPPADPEALAGAIGELVSDVPRRRRLGAAARQTFERRFSSNVLVGALRDLYAEAGLAV